MRPLTEHIKFIGVEDDNIDLFEGQYPVPNGISYNSYLIDDEFITIIDSVDRRRCGDWLDAIAGQLGDSGAAPAYLVVQHMEPDHSGSIGLLLEKYPATKVVCTAKAADMLANFFEDIDFASRCHIVKDGDELCIGRATLRFVTAPMVHWPEVMMTLDVTDGVLFTADAFGTFSQSSSTDGWDAEARRYYCNIVGRFGASVQTVMKKLSTLKFNIIAPLHGPALTENLSHYWMLYKAWCSWEPESDGVLIAYASVYGGTAEAARRLAAMLKAHGAREVVLIDLCRRDVSYAVAEAFRMRNIVLCSVTYDGALFPAMHNFLHHIERKNLQNRRVALIENGSWAPVAARLMGDTLAKMKNMTIVEPVIKLRSRLHRADIDQLDQLAANIMNK